ncbi:hypothetical protein, partial [Actinomyces viscosus]
MLSLDTAAYVASPEHSEAINPRTEATSSEASETVVEIDFKLCAAFQAPDGSVTTRASRAIQTPPRVAVGVAEATSSSVSRKLEAVTLNPLAVVRSEEAAPDVLEDSRLSTVDTAEEERPTSGSAGKEAPSRPPATPSSLPAAWSRISGSMYKVPVLIGSSPAASGYLYRTIVTLLQPDVNQ